MSVIYQSTALVIGPPERIAELARISRDVNQREILYLKDSQLVLTEWGNYGESLTGDALDWAEHDMSLEVLVSWDNEGGNGASYGMRGGVKVFEEYDDDIFTAREEATSPVSSDAAWARLMGNTLCRLVPSNVALSAYLPGYLRPDED